jgi:predicted RNA-binding protein YlxR (DUF448 family)
MSPRHVPQRTCVQCRKVRPKRELVRVVRSPQGTVEIDEKGKAAGRGAYLCRNRVCWENALKVHISAEDKQRLLAYGQCLEVLEELVPEKGDDGSRSG